MKYFSIILSLFALFVSNSKCFSQLAIRGTIYSDNIVTASIEPEHIHEREPLYLYPTKKSGVDESTEFFTKYEVPERLVKNENYIIRFTDGTVEKVVYVSGAVPEEIIPKQKFHLDIDLKGKEEPDMTLIIFWSMSQSSYRALPLSRIDEIRSDSDPDFFWEDGFMREDQILKGSAD